MKMSRSVMDEPPRSYTLDLSASFRRGSRKKIWESFAVSRGLVGSAQRAQQPGAGVSPQRVRGARRDAQRLGGLRDRQTGEVAELDQLGGLRVGGGKQGQRLVQVEQ